ncbi:serine hydrolase [Roseisolibacter agri]|uniref:Serine hydrolase n=1 Tax=Roseisolibacter agri TaxID=2014610 RepID=A0AA37Q5P4_9BACT|nr:serine hydrolase [Roseisolibacter agri]
MAPRALSIVLAAIASAACADATLGAQSLPRATPGDVGLSAEALARIAPAMRAYTDSGKLGGMLVAVARHGRLAYLETFGTADVRTGAPLASDAVFRMYSMTKPVTAVAVLQLVERGTLGLDDPVARYIPAFAEAAVYAGGGAAHPTTTPAVRPITIRQLLMHTSGMAYGLGVLAPDSIANARGLFVASRTVAGFADTVARIPLAFQPGARWRYGPGLEVLGRVVEIVDGRPFERYLDEEIFTPLGMRSTAMRLTPALRARLAGYYERGPDGRLRTTRGMVPQDLLEPAARFACGGCGLVSTAGDYLRFAQMLLNDGTLDGVRILRPESAAELRRDALPPALGPIPAGNFGPGTGFGLGVAVQRDRASPENPSAPGTFGWSGAANTYFWVDPANGVIGMVLTQHHPPFSYPLLRETKQLVYAALVAPDSTAPATPPRRPR